MSSEIIYLLLGLMLGLAILLYVKQNSVPKSGLEELQKKLKESEISLALQNDRYNNKLSELEKNRQSLSENLETQGKLIRENAMLLANVEKTDQFHQKLSLNHEGVKQSNLQQQEEINKLSKVVSDLSAQRNFLEEKLNNQKTEMEEIRRISQLEFQNIANKILDEKVSKFTQTNKDNIDTILKPLGENLEQFKKKVEETYDIESKQRFSLEEKVKELMEHSNRISVEANNLTNALKGQSKKQGNWGEIILESILEKSGLQKNREYKIQPTFQNEEGQTLRPDVIIYLPEERSMIVDSKVSLVAYDRYCSSETKEDQDIQLALHLSSIYQHIDDLGKKRYDEFTKGLDFMMMFIPIEPAYLLAIQEDQDLWLYAYNKRILLISPTNLITALKLVNELWKRDQQSKNAIEIAKQGERLYEKIVGFLETMDDVERNINRTQDTFLKAKKQLRDGKGNLVGQAQRLKNMGINSEKELPGLLNPTEEEDTES
ncbi:MAG: DNA recombination protein RmuC [Saprospiraceae bacterium]